MNDPSERSRSRHRCARCAAAPGRRVGTQRSGAFRRARAGARRRSSATLGGLPLQARLHAARRRRHAARRHRPAGPVSRTRAVRTRRCTAAGSWTMRQIAGFGTAEDTNGRFKYLIAQGQTGLSTDFDMPTLMGYDSDHPMSEGEVGREGVAIDTLADMEHLFDGIDLEKHLGVDDDQPERVDPARDVRRARAEARLRPRTGCRARSRPTSSRNTRRRRNGSSRSRRRCASCATASRTAPRNMKRYNPINISGLPHLRGGLVAARRGGVHDVQPHHLRRGGAARPGCTSTSSRRGSRSSTSARPTSSRRSPSSARCGASTRRSCASASARKNPESMRLRFHCQTAAASLTKPQYQINVVRTGPAGAGRGARRRAEPAHQRHGRGVRDPHRGGDEDRAAHAADHRRRDRASPSVVDPLGGSYFVESLTTQYEREIFEVIDEVDRRGGTIKLTEEGWFQRRIADFAYETALKKASGEKPVIGVNRYVDAGRDVRRRDASVRSDDRRAPDRAPQRRCAASATTREWRRCSTSSSPSPRDERAEHHAR